MRKPRRDKKAKEKGAGGEAAVQHIRQIDVLKGLAVIAVILIHTFSDNILAAIGGPFHIMQAVPVFILLAAFTSAYALVTYRKKTLAAVYDLSIIFRRMKRILGPYVVVWIAELVLILYVISKIPNFPFQYVNNFAYDGFGIVLNFFSGGQGPGSYFIPVILQQILLLPLLYYLAQRTSPERMLAVAFILDIALEYLTIAAGIPAWLYGLLYTRYLFAGALGIWLVFRKDSIPKWLYAGVITSIAYIVAVQYFNFQFPFIYPAWSFFHAFSYFWTVLIVIAGLQLLPSGSLTGILSALEKLGKASWHIFLTQMAFLFFAWPVLVQFTVSDASIVILPVLNLAACLSLGYGFYLLHITVSKTIGRLAQ
ncbi:MAG: Acyltransferase family protein [Methanoregula sp. PtaU1.Bin051]|nr:MAG: Acyltransferase family protein [Methanoregula sp. PtaU1.Bin051]